MNILFSADWHLKLGAKNIPNEWAKNRYLEFFERIRELEKEVSLHIIGGDIFDRVPNLEELELYFEFVRNAKIETIIFDGNHEATRKNKTFLSSLKSVTETLNPMVKIVDDIYQDERGFSILPYCHLHRKGAIEELNQDLPLFTHVRGEIPPHVTPEVDLDRFKRFPVVFAGDLHAQENSQRNIVYPGSPMTTSFHRSKVNTGVLVILDDWEWAFQYLPLPQLLRKTVTDEEEMIPGTYDHVIYEIQGDLSDLAQVKDNELLDKKVVKRSSEATLLLSKEMTVAEELFEYLTYVLEISEEKIPAIIGTFNDYAKNT